MGHKQYYRNDCMARTVSMSLGTVQGPRSLWMARRSPSDASGQGRPAWKSTGIVGTAEFPGWGVPQFLSATPGRSVCRFEAFVYYTFTSKCLYVFLLIRGVCRFLPLEVFVPHPSMVSLWIPYGFLMVALWASYRFPMISYSFPIESLRFS